MEPITNNQIVIESSKVLGHQVQNKPELDTSKIVLVADVAPKHNRIVNFSVSSVTAVTGALNITLPSASQTQEVFITAITFTFSKDATCDTASSVFNVTGQLFNGPSATTLWRPCARLTTTAERDSVTIIFPIPMKMQPASTISEGATFTAGAMTRGLTLFGYVADN